MAALAHKDQLEILEPKALGCKASVGSKELLDRQVLREIKETKDNPARMDSKEILVFKARLDSKALACKVCKGIRAILELKGVRDFRELLELERKVSKESKAN